MSTGDKVFAGTLATWTVETGSGDYGGLSGSGNVIVDSSNDTVVYEGELQKQEACVARSDPCSKGRGSVAVRTQLSTAGLKASPTQC